MSTPDASQFIQQKKFQAVQRRLLTYSPKVITHLYSHVPTISALLDFLPSFSNKRTNTRTFTHINLKTGIQLKSRKVPSQFMQG